MSDFSPEGLAEQKSTHIHRLFQSKRPLPVALGLGLITLAVILTTGRHNAGLRTRYVAVTQKIASGRVVVKPLDRLEYRISITPEMFNAQVIGSFTAYGGSNNTVSVVLAPEAHYQNWITGDDARKYYSSDGQKSEDRFAARLDPGEYEFAISNRLSKKAMKYVFLDVELIYQRAERF